MSLFSSALGLDAANNSQKAAQSQQNRNKKIAVGGGALFDQAMPWAQDVYAQLGQTNIAQALGAGLNQFNADPSVAIGQFGAGATEAASNNAAQQAALLKSQGLGDGAVAGVAANLFQDANRQTNAFAAQQMSPEERYRRMMALLQSLSGVAGGVGNVLGTPAQLVLGQPQVQQMANPLAAALGQVAGGYAGALGKKLGGGK